MSRALAAHVEARPKDILGILSIPYRYWRSGVEFAFDERKSRANKAKHGIDFVAAQALWADEALIECRPAARPRRVT